MANNRKSIPRGGDSRGRSDPRAAAGSDGGPFLVARENRATYRGIPSSAAAISPCRTGQPYQTCASWRQRATKAKKNLETGRFSFLLRRRSPAHPESEQGICFLAERPARSSKTSRSSAAAASLQEAVTEATVDELSHPPRWGANRGTPQLQLVRIDADGIRRQSGLVPHASAAVAFSSRARRENEPPWSLPRWRRPAP